MAKPSRLSFVTTCKGRLDFLKQSLPRLVAIKDCECVVVDYDCPQGAGAWVRENHPKVKVVQVPDRPYFNVAAARNLGVKASTAPWLLLIDSDTLAKPGLLDALVPIMKPGQYAVPQPRELETYGAMLVSRADFDRVDGFDEVFEGWGAEDDDFLRRLRLIGVKANGFPSTLLSFVPHDEALRTAHYTIRDRETNQGINALYLSAKHVLIRQGVTMDEAMRRDLYGNIRKLVLDRKSDGDKSTLNVQFLTTTAGDWTIESAAVFRLTRGKINPSPL